MRLHANAALSLRQRERMALRVVDQGWSLGEAARGRGQRADGIEGSRLSLPGAGRSARPFVGASPSGQPHRRPDRAAIVALRRLRMSGPEIAELLAARCRRFRRCSRVGWQARRLVSSLPGAISALAPGADPHRRQKACASKAARQAHHCGSSHYNPRPTDREGKRRSTVGWECVHIAIDDATRLAYAEVLCDETTTAIGFLRRALRTSNATHPVERLLTDNGSPYVSNPRHRLPRPGIRHLRTRPRRPQPTQSRALHPHHARRLAYSGAVYGSSANAPQHLTAALHYNHRRPHTAIGDNHPSTS